MNFFQTLIETYNKGLKYDSLKSSYDSLYNVLSTERKQFTKIINDLEKENILSHNQILHLENERESYLKPVIEPFVLDKSLSLLKKKIQPEAYKYPFKGDGRDYDIKYSLIVTGNSLIVKYGDIIDKKYSPSTPTECCGVVQQYFYKDKIPKYVSDDIQFNKRDYWQPVDEFLQTWNGDCDEVARAMHILIKYLLDKKGFSEHYDRLYLHINNNYLEGHANNIWLHDDGYFYTIESTIDLKGSYERKWLHVPLGYDSFYTKTRGIANLNGSHKGSNAIHKNYKN